MEEKARVIAIVADEFTENHPLAEKLREDGFRAEVVNRQQATCERLAALNPDIIITDADVGNAVNPFHLIIDVRGDGRLNNAEIFFYSTSIDVKTEIALRKLKVNAFFIKSDNIGYLVDAAHTHFKGFEIISSNVAEEMRALEAQDALEDQEAESGSPANAPGVESKGFESSDEFTNMFADLVDDTGENQKTDESHFEALYNLGVSYYEKELYGKAIEKFEKVGQSSAWRLKSLLMTGMTQKKMGEMETAVGTFKTGYRDCADESGKADFLYELGDTLDAIGKMDEAYKMFAAVYQKNKEFRDVRARLVRLKSAIEIRNKS
jgi:tetratricopeptide (TPR) repeat protein